MADHSTSTPSLPPVPRALDRTAGYAWRILLIAAVVAGGVWLAGQLLVVLIPLGVGALIARALWPVVEWLTRRGLGRGFATVLAMLGAAVVVGGLLTAFGAQFASEWDSLKTAAADGIDDLERWLVEDSPFNLDQADIARFRDQATQWGRQFLRSSGGGVMQTIGLVGEVMVGLLLAVILTFAFLKDGRKLAAGVVRAAPTDRRAPTAAGLRGAWAALGGYLRGAVILGVVEAVLIAVTAQLVGAELVLQIALVTFLGAFVPIVGAITAGAISVLVTLATAGGGPAIIVAVVAIIVQQLDNDILAPVLYGRQLQLHPLSILLGVTAGGALFGLIGTIAAVPVLAVATNSYVAFRRTLADGATSSDVAHDPVPKPAPQAAE